MSPFMYKPPYIFSRNSCTGIIFIPQIGPPNHSHATKIATWSFVETPTLSRSPWWSGQCQNEASIHRTAEESANDCKCVHVWHQRYSTLKGQNTQSAWKMPPSMLWPTSVSRSWPLSFWRTREAKADPCWTSFFYCNVMFLCPQHDPGRGGIHLR